MRCINPQTTKHMHECQRCVRQYRESLWCFKYVLFIPALLYDTWLITGGRWNLQDARLSTYRAWPSSYDVKTQRSALTKKDNRHAFCLTFLKTDRGETREQWDGRRLWHNNPWLTPGELENDWIYRRTEQENAIILCIKDNSVTHCIKLINDSSAWGDLKVYKWELTSSLGLKELIFILKLFETVPLSNVMGLMIIHI